MMKSIIRMIALLVVVLVLAGCEAEEPIPEGVLKVLATTGMVADTVRHVGGEHVHVTALMGPGVDPHLYKATKGDVDRLESADLILYNGLYLEAKMSEILEKMSRGKHVVAISETIDSSLLLSAASARQTASGLLTECAHHGRDRRSASC